MITCACTASKGYICHSSWWYLVAMKAVASDFLFICSSLFIVAHLYMVRCCLLLNVAQFLHVVPMLICCSLLYVQYVVYVCVFIPGPCCSMLLNVAHICTHVAQYSMLLPPSCSQTQCYSLTQRGSYHCGNRGNCLTQEPHASPPRI